uniref:Uncharacterized protein n=1 Tax=Triticum urartu TaxID=4572 RepID=A0A8R7UET6_TRIUA
MHVLRVLVACILNGIFHVEITIWVIMTSSKNVGSAAARCRIWLST